MTRIQSPKLKGQDGKPMKIKGGIAEIRQGKDVEDSLVLFWAY